MDPDQRLPDLDLGSDFGTVFTPEFFRDLGRAIDAELPIHAPVIQMLDEIAAAPVHPSGEQATEGLAVVPAEGGAQDTRHADEGTQSVTQSIAAQGATETSQAGRSRVARFEGITKALSAVTVLEFSKNLTGYLAANALSSVLTPKINELSEQHRSLISNLLNGTSLGGHALVAFGPDVAPLFKKAVYGDTGRPPLNKAQLLGRVLMFTISVVCYAVSVKLGDPKDSTANVVRAYLLVLFPLALSLFIKTETNRNENNGDSYGKALLPAVPYTFIYLFFNELVGLPHSYTGGNPATATHSFLQNLLNMIGPSALYALAETYPPIARMLYDWYADTHAPDPQHWQKQADGQPDDPNAIPGDRPRSEGRRMKADAMEVRVEPRFPSLKVIVDALKSVPESVNFFNSAFNLGETFGKLSPEVVGLPSTAEAIKVNSPANWPSALLFGALRGAYELTLKREAPVPPTGPGTVTEIEDPAPPTGNTASPV